MGTNWVSPVMRKFTHVHTPGVSDTEISHCPLHADFTFMGNKNGTGSKLGGMQVQTCDYSQDIATTDSNDKQSHTTDTI